MTLIDLRKNPLETNRNRLVDNDFQKRRSWQEQKPCKTRVCWFRGMQGLFLGCQCNLQIP